MSQGAKLNLARERDHAQPVWCVHWSPKRAPGRLDQILQLKGFARRCASKHRNSRRETAGWDRIDRQEVFVLCWKAGPSPNVGSAKSRAGSIDTPGPFNLHKSRTSSCSRVSKTQLAWGGTRATCQFLFGVVADKECTCPASRLMWERYPPTPPISLRGE